MPGKHLGPHWVVELQRDWVWLIIKWQTSAISGEQRHWWSRSFADILPHTHRLRPEVGRDREKWRQLGGNYSQRSLDYFDLLIEAERWYVLHHHNPWFSPTDLYMERENLFSALWDVSVSLVKLLGTVEGKLFRELKRRFFFKGGSSVHYLWA